MKAGDKEFYELREQFEKDIRNMPIYGHRMDRVQRDDDTPAGVFYNDGNVNQLFIAYMAGYEYAKCLSRIAA